MKQIKTESQYKVIKLKELYETGLEIVETNNLYDIWKTIPKGETGSFNQMIKQNINPKKYQDWWIHAETTFRDGSLNFLRFKKNIVRHDQRSNETVGFAGFLLLALDEIEHMIDMPVLLDAYILSSRRSQTWPEIIYQKGTVTQGDNQHKFSDTNAINMLDELWTKRKIIKPDKSIVRAGEATTWDSLPKTVDSSKGTAQAINKSMRLKSINLAVTYPKKLRGLQVVVTQK